MADESTFTRRKPARSQPIDDPRTRRRRASAADLPEQDRPSPEAPAGPGDPAVDSLDRTGRIARRAYELYEARGGTGGDELQDWLEAERQIDAEDAGPRLE